MNHLKEYGTKLIDLGYQIIPIVYKKKYPPIKEWQKTKATPEMVDEWVRAGHKGIGILCAQVPCVDIDVKNKELSMWMADRVQEIAGTGPIRVGLAPKTLLPFKTLKGFSKMSSKKIEDLKGDLHQVEILGIGNQFVAFGVHPCGKEYVWDVPLNEIAWGDLPTLGRVQAEKIIEVFHNRCFELGWKVQGALASIYDAENLPPDDGTKEALDKAAHNIGYLMGSTKDALTGSSPFPEVEGGAGVGKDAAVPYQSFEEWDAQQDVDPGRLQLEDYVIKKALDDVDPEKLDYDGWLKVGMAIYHQLGADGGKDVWTEWSERDKPRFDPGAIDEKWSTFKPAPGRRPTTFRTVLKMAEKTRKEQDVLQEYIDRYVYIESEDTVHDLYGPPHKSSPALKNFRTRTASDELEIDVPRPLKDDPDRVVPKKIPVCVIWLKNDEKKWVSGETYYPNNGMGSRIKSVGEYDYLNTFRMPTFPAPVDTAELDVVNIQKALIQPFFNHMAYLFPIKEEREWFINWMALNLQHPDRRCKVTPLHISLHHGTGRGWLVSLLGKLLGSWNCTKTKMTDIVEGAWGNYLDKSLLCCVEEVHEGNKPYEVSEALRDILTEDTLQLNVKYGGIETKRVFTNFFFMSNRADALILKDTDRRINVFKMVDGPRDKEYYMALYKWSKGKGEGTDDEVATPGVAALWHWLASRDLSGFNWQTSIKSDSRNSLIVNSENKVEMYFREIMKEYPFGVITVKALKSIMGRQAESEEDDPWQFEGPKIDRQMAKMLQQIGWRAGGLTRVNSVLHRYWWDGKTDIRELNYVRNAIREMYKWNCIQN